MSREIPEVVRAAAGLAATVLDEARKLPETLPGLPVRLIGLAMQQAMKLQQAYAGLVARGDELFTGLRGDNEPGLATFDDDDDVAEATGFRDSAFDRVSDDAVAPLAAVTGLAGATVDDDVVDSASGAETAERSIEAVGDAPTVEEVLDELAIDEAVPEMADTDPLTVPADGVTSVDVLTPDGGIETVDAAITDEGIAAVEAPQDAPGTDETVATTDGAAADTGDDASGGTPAARRAPVDGYDNFSIAQLRGRMRGYALSTVADLLAYEEATRSREPYLRMLRNRLEKLEEQAVAASPLAPRGL